MVWIGSTGAEALQLLQLAYSTCAWLCCEPIPIKQCNDRLTLAPAMVRCNEGLAAGTQVLLKRRYFLVEKAKQASIVGILVSARALRFRS